MIMKIIFIISEKVKTLPSFCFLYAQVNLPSFSSLGILIQVFRKNENAFFLVFVKYYESDYHGFQHRVKTVVATAPGGTFSIFGISLPFSGSLREFPGATKLPCRRIGRVKPPYEAPTDGILTAPIPCPCGHFDFMI